MEMMMSPAKTIYDDVARSLWFDDMSPRQSLGSDGGPPHDEANVENVENVAPNVVEQEALGKQKSSTNMANAKARLTNAASQPQQTSNRASVRQPGTPQSARSTFGREQVLPCMRPSTKSRKEGSAVSTPEHSAMSDDARNTSINKSVSEPSCSMSCSSRLHQLSRRSTNRRAVSSEEMQMQELEEKRRLLQRQTRRNQKNVIKSRVPPESCIGSTRPTLPKEFNLSVRTPRVVNGDGEDSVGSAKRVVVTKNVWRPQLGNPHPTVPRGPSFLERLARRSISCPPKNQGRDDRSDICVPKGQPGRSPNPERQNGLQAALDRAFCERAERARQSAVAKNEKEAVIKTDHRASFTMKSPTSQPEASSQAKAQPKQTQRWSSFGIATRPCCRTKKLGPCSRISSHASARSFRHLR